MIMSAISLVDIDVGNANCRIILKILYIQSKQARWREGGKEGEEGREGSNQADKCTSSNYMKIQYLWTQGLCANFSFHLLSHLVA